MRRTVFFTVVVGSLALSTLPSPARAKKADPPYGTGNLDKGEIKMPLYRGAAVPFELTVVATPQNCEAHADLEIRWNRQANKVTVKIEAEDAFDHRPTIDRTLGVDYLPNPFFPEPEDVVDGRYQLWIISAAGPVETFFYDVDTLDLIAGPGDEVPVPAIPVPFPTLYMFGTPMFEPKHNGKVKVNWTFPYDSPHRGDRPEFSYHVVSFPPPNLCGANPFRLDLSTLRPWISDPLPREAARPWDDYLRGGLLFDITVEPGEYFTEPPLTTLTATYSGATAVGGAIPKGWQLDIDGAFANLAPPIKPWKGAGTCENVFEGFHTQGLNFCAP